MYNDNTITLEEIKQVTEELYNIYKDKKGRKTITDKELVEFLKIYEEIHKENMPTHIKEEMLEIEFHDEQISVQKSQMEKIVRNSVMNKPISDAISVLKAYGIQAIIASEDGFVYDQISKNRVDNDSETSPYRANLIVTGGIVTEMSIG